MNWHAPEIDALIRAALREDQSRRDLTTNLLIKPSWRLEAKIVAKQNGVVCGLPLAKRIFEALDPKITFRATAVDGTFVRKRQPLASIRGRAKAILTGERPALNMLQHLSGIATFTHEQVAKLKGSKTKLYDTRKTLPGWRKLQKYAVVCGGGQNHRMTLGDEVMIKENHLAIVRLAGADWLGQVQRAKEAHPSRIFQIEVQTQRDLADALQLKPQRIMLDNLPPKTMRKMMHAIRKGIPGVKIEFTGGIKPENVRALSRLNPDRMSMGRLTHSSPSFDCGLDITRVYTS